MAEKAFFVPEYLHAEYINNKDESAARRGGCKQGPIPATSELGHSDLTLLDDKDTAGDAGELRSGGSGDVRVTYHVQCVRHDGGGRGGRGTAARIVQMGTQKWTPLMFWVLPPPARS